MEASAKPGVLLNRVLFEEACTSIIDAVQHMPRLKTLHLEPIAEDSLVPEVLFTLGKEVQELCILGEILTMLLLNCRVGLLLCLEGLLRAPTSCAYALSQCICSSPVSHQDHTMRWLS